MVNRKYQKYWTVLDYTNSLHPNPPQKQRYRWRQRIHCSKINTTEIKILLGEEKDVKSETKKRGKIATNAHVVPKEHIKG